MKKFGIKHIKFYLNIRVYAFKLWLQIFQLNFFYRFLIGLVQIFTINVFYQKFSNINYYFTQRGPSSIAYMFKTLDLCRFKSGQYNIIAATLFDRRRQLSRRSYKKLQFHFQLLIFTAKKSCPRRQSGGYFA